MRKIIGTVISVDENNVWLREEESEVNVVWPAANADVRAGHQLRVVAELNDGRLHLLTAQNISTGMDLKTLDEVTNVNIVLAGVISIVKNGGVLGAMLCFFPLINLIGGSIFAIAAFFKAFTDKATVRPMLLGLATFAVSMAVGLALQQNSRDNILGWILIGFSATFGCVVYAGLLFRTEVENFNTKAREANRILTA